MASPYENRARNRNGSLPPEVVTGLEEAGGLEKIQASLPDESTIRTLAERHQALSDQVRISILFYLRGSDLCPCVLKDLTGLSDSKLSYHLSILEKAGMAEWRQNKNWRVYRLTGLGRSYLDGKTI